jgi:hypothetical protein
MLVIPSWMLGVCQLGLRYAVLKPKLTAARDGKEACLARAAQPMKKGGRQPRKTAPQGPRIAGIAGQCTCLPDIVAIKVVIA